MKTLLAACGILLLCGCAGEGTSSTSSQVEAAARHASAGVSWQAASVISGDFTCRARPEHAILGMGDGEIVVLVVVASEGKLEPVGMIRFPASGKEAHSVVLSRDDLDFAVEDFERDVGPMPEGLYPSRTCFGLSVSDRHSDAVHIYWNRKARRFESWARQ